MSFLTLKYKYEFILSTIRALVEYIYIIVPTNAHMCTKINLYIQLTPTGFGQTCGVIVITPLHWS